MKSVSLILTYPEDATQQIADFVKYLNLNFKEIHKLRITIIYNPLGLWYDLYIQCPSKRIAREINNLKKEYYTADDTARI